MEGVEESRILAGIGYDRLHLGHQVAHLLQAGFFVLSLDLVGLVPLVLGFHPQQDVQQASYFAGFPLPCVLERQRFYHLPQAHVDRWRRRRPAFVDRLADNDRIASQMLRVAQQPQFDQPALNLPLPRIPRGKRQSVDLLIIPCRILSPGTPRATRGWLLFRHGFACRGLS